MNHVSLMNHYQFSPLSDKEVFYKIIRLVKSWQYLFQDMLRSELLSSGCDEALDSTHTTAISAVQAAYAVRFLFLLTASTIVKMSLAFVVLIEYENRNNKLDACGTCYKQARKTTCIQWQVV